MTTPAGPKAEHWRNCTEIFDAAVELSPPDRAAFLEQRCAGNEVLRRKIELLLKYHEKSDSFIDSPAFEALPELLLDDTDALIGQHLGRYRIESVLGIGGMGVVYLARDEGLGRKIGLKLLPQSLVANQTQLEALKREARTASALNHPNIVTIHEIGEVEGIHYIATEFIEGITLRERMAQGPISPNESLEIAQQIASALSVAHAAGIVHRDVKPENIMLRPDGYVKMLDFGIAKFVQQEPALETRLSTGPEGTQQSIISGTTRYMSPEQLKGEMVDARSDIWSLGVSLYEMLAGFPPFAGETPGEMLLAALENEPPSLSETRPDLAPELELMIRAMLVKERAARYLTATEVRTELQRLQARVARVAAAKAPTVAAKAYDHYLRGKFFLHRQNVANNEAAIAALERSVAIDPSFAAAHAELAQAYLWKLFLFAPKEGQWAEKAYIEAEKALALDPDSAVAYLARGRLLWTPANRFPHENAIREYRRSLALNPALDEARNQLALVYCHVGLLDEALEESHKAIASNPNNNLAQYRIGETLNSQGKYEQALAALRVIPLDASPALVGHQIVWALFNLGRREEAAATAEQFLGEYPEDHGGLFVSLQGILAAAAGDEATAETRIKQAVERGKGFGHFHHTAYHIACAYALMQKPEQAITWLEMAADDGFPCYPLFLRDANLGNLRKEDRFSNLLVRLETQWKHFRSLIDAT